VEDGNKQNAACMNGYAQPDTDEKRAIFMNVKANRFAQREI
jgi:hypothetical protein